MLYTVGQRSDSDELFPVAASLMRQVCSETCLMDTGHKPINDEIKAGEFN